MILKTKGFIIRLAILGFMAAFILQMAFTSRVYANETIAPTIIATQHIYNPYWDNLNSPPLYPFPSFKVMADHILKRLKETGNDALFGTCYWNEGTNLLITCPDYGTLGATFSWPGAYSCTDPVSGQSTGVSFNYVSHDIPHQCVSCPDGYDDIGPVETRRCVRRADYVVVEKNEGEPPGAVCGLGNPVNVGPGNKYQKEVDIPYLGSGSVEFYRVYNHLAISKGILNGEASNIGVGRQWRHTYQRRVLLNQNDYITTAEVLRPDGKVYFFNNVSGNWQAEGDVQGKLERITDQAGDPIGWTFTSNDEDVENYDVDGKLTEIHNSGGDIKTLSYNVDGYLERVESSSGNYIIFEYLTNGIDRIRSITDQSGRAWIFPKDGKYNLSSVINPDGTIRQYHYEHSDFPNTLTGITDERGIRYATYEYDASGRATATYHGPQTGVLTDRIEGVSISYNDTDGTRTVTDSNGSVSTYSTAVQLGVALVTDITGPGCTGCGNGNTSYVYDPLNNNLMSKTKDGITTEYGGYDANGNAGFMIEAAGTANARRTDYTYDSRFHSKVLTRTEPSVYAGGNKVTTYTYDAFGNATSITINGFTPAGIPVSRTTNLQYTGPLNQLSQIDGPRSGVSDITTLDYYLNEAAQGNNRARLRSVTSGGIALRDNIQYTATGKVASEVRPNNLTLGYSYYSGNDRLETLTESGGGSSRTTRWTYLATGEVASITTADGTPDATNVTFTYDDARRLTRITDGLGNYIAYTLDTEGNQLAENVYDSSGVLQRSLTQTFDVYNRLDTTAQANEFSDQDFAADGTLSQSTDGNGTATTYSYDDLKRLLASTNNAGSAGDTTDDVLTQYGYDTADNLTSVIDPTNGTTNYQYDDLGNLIIQTSPDTGTTSFTYDNAGNVTTRTDAKGQTLTYSYDALNRLTQLDAPGTADDIGYGYDLCTNGTGRLCSVTINGDSVVYGYNVHGDITQHQGTTYTYDAAGRVKTMTYLSGAIVTYSYDNAGNINDVTLDQGGSVTTLASAISYAPFGPVTNLTYGNGTTLTQSLDSAYRLTDQSTPNTLSLAYSQYDANGNLLTRNSDSFSYDPLNRLDTANGSFGTRDYDYDKNGNRSQLISDAVTTSYSYSPNSNRISTINTDSITLDANGNLQNLRGMSFGHNVHNRLTSVNGTITYAYNGLGQRVSKTQNTGGMLPGDADGNGTLDSNDANTALYHILGTASALGMPDCNQDTSVNVLDLVCINNAIAAGTTTPTSNTTQFVYDTAGHLLGAYDSLGTSYQEIIYLNDMPLAVMDGSNIYYIHNDHLNTPQTLTDSSGTVVWNATYDPFGQATVNEDPDNNGVSITFNPRLPGQYYDTETGLHYNYFRYYDPQTGRYTTSDPIGLTGGLNTYTYGLSNPLYWVDPLGLDVFVGQHPAFVNSQYNPLNHAAIVLRPDNPSDFANHPLFQKTNGKEATLGGQAFGEGWGLFGKLVSAPNYPGDDPTNLKDLTKVCRPEGQSDTGFIKKLINAAEAYKNNALYDPFPDAFGWTYNSNSYASGVIKAAGGNPPSLPGLRPGYNRPLPIPLR